MSRGPKQVRSPSAGSSRDIGPIKLDYEFAVAPDGRATMHMPLWVPSGRAGMQPDLALDYDSRTGNGLLGVGWDISSRSAIVRVRRNHFHDGRAEPVAFGAEDPFEIDGMRLVLISGVHGKDGAEYRTFPDLHARIVLHAPDALGPTSFTLYDADGRILTYGSDDSSRLAGDRYSVIVPPSGEGSVVGWTIDDDLNGLAPVTVPARYGWLLSSIRDRTGNTIYYYWSDFQSGAGPGPDGKTPLTRVLTEIDYTARAAHLRRPRTKGRAPQRSVQFIYDERPDTSEIFVSGFRMWNIARLRRIETYGPDNGNPTMLRAYDFDYELGSTNRSLLTSIAVSWDGAPAPVLAHRFDYSENAGEFEEIDTGISDIRTSPGGRSSLPGRIHVLDIDGDGRDDIFYASASRPGYFAFRLSRTDANGKPCLSEEHKTDIQLSARPERPIPFDHDADGRCGILSYDDQNAIPDTNGYGAGYIISAPVNTGSSWSLAAVAPVSALFAQAADVDGDGRTDLILVDDAPSGAITFNWSYELNSTGQFGPDTGIGIVSGDDHLLVDIDGDGATELLTCLGQLGGPAIPGQWLSSIRVARPSPPPGFTVTSLRSGEPYLFADLSGDGLADAVWQGAIEQDPPYVIRNSGNGYFPPVQQTFIHQYYGDPVKRAIDIDLDGRQEIIIRYNSDFAPDPLLVVKWTDSGFAKPVQLPFGSICYKPEEAEVFEILDLTGNGLDDMIMYNNGTLRLYCRKGDCPDLMTCSTDGYGAVITIDYSSLADPNIYERSNDQVAYPGRPNGAKAWVVSAHSEDDGIGGANHYQHSYGGCLTDLRLPGQFAFSRYSRVHLERGSTFGMRFDLSQRGDAGFFALVGLPVTSWTATAMPASEHVVSEETQYELRWDASGATYFAVPTKSILKEGVGPGGGLIQFLISEKTTGSQWDDYGNLTSKSETWGDGRTCVTVTTFDVRPADWLVALRALEQVTDTSASGDQRVRTTAWVHDSLGRLEQTIVEPGTLAASVWQPLPAQADGVQTLYESLTRNADGLVSAIVRHDSPAPGASSRKTVLNYDQAEGIDLVQVTDALGHSTATSWRSGLGVVATSTDGNGITTTYTSDGLGRVRSVNGPGGVYDTVNYAGSPLGPPVVITWRDGGVLQRVQHDRLGRIIEARSWARDDDLMVTHQWNFDGLGRVQSETVPYLPAGTVRRVHYRYDALDRLIFCSLPDSTAWNYRYGDSESFPPAVGTLRLVTITDPRNNRRLIYFDQSGRTVQAREGGAPQGPATRIVFGAADEPVAMGLEGTQPIRVSYDRLGRVVATDDPDRGHQTLSWSAFGELASITGANGSIVATRDLLGRTTSILAPEGTTNVVWDSAANGIGKPDTVTSPSGVSTIYRYDSAARLIRKTWKTSSGTMFLACAYDAKGRLYRLGYPKPGAVLTIEYEYGNYGQITAVNELPGKVPLWTLVSSDATGQFNRCTLSNGAVEERVEDPLRPGYVGWIRAWKGAKPLMRLRLSFDANGNLYTRSDKLSGVTETFGYDDQDRLFDWSFEGTSAIGGSSFHYDLNGNLAARGGNFADHFHSQPGNGGPHAAALTGHGSYSFDGTGCEIVGPGRSASYTSFGLPASMMVKGQTWTFSYTGGGERVVKSNVTLHRETLSAEGLYIRNVRAGSVEHRCRIYLPTGGLVERVFTKAGSGPVSSETYHLHVDNVLNVRAVSDTGGTVQRLGYEPFGRRVDPKDMAKTVLPPAGGTLGFAGHDHDDELSLINMKGRLYDPELARFITPDPLIKDVRIAAAYSCYSYAFNNPQTWRDPTGFDPDNQSIPDPPSTDSASASTGTAGSSGSPSNVCSAGDNGVDAQSSSPAGQQTTAPSATTASSASVVVSDDGTTISGLVGTQVYVPAPLAGLALTPIPNDPKDGGTPSQQDQGTDPLSLIGDVGNVGTVIGGPGSALVPAFKEYNLLRWLKTSVQVVRATSSAIVIERGLAPPGLLNTSRIWGPVGKIGTFGSIVGVGAAVVGVVTARNKYDRVQSVSDGLFSSSGLVAELPLPPQAKMILGSLSFGYSFGQLVDHASTPAGQPMKGLSGWIGNIGFRSDHKTLVTRFGLWLGGHLHL